MPLPPQAVDFSQIQFKELNGAALKHMDPKAVAAAANMQSALGSEYAGGFCGF